jgi:ribosomal protein S18 acetylase RimI-like enzyme
MVARHSEEPQLHMVWPAASRRQCPAVHPAAGYSVRTFRAGDEQAFLSLMSLMDFDPWDDAKLDYNMSRIIPDGWFFATDPSDRVVATAMCLHDYTGRSPFTGDVGWVACHPEHRGRRLGLCLTAHVTRRFLDAGYAAIQLHTESYRFPAIKTDLTPGYVPSIASAQASIARKEGCRALQWPFTPDAWHATA